MRPGPRQARGVSTVPWLANQIKSIHNSLGNDPDNAITMKDVFRGGNIMQVGGEFLFEDGQVVWCHRMKNFRNHEVERTRAPLSSFRTELPIWNAVLGKNLLEECQATIPNPWRRFILLCIAIVQRLSLPFP